jgi:hypothetical protein
MTVLKSRQIAAYFLVLPLVFFEGCSIVSKSYMRDTSEGLVLAISNHNDPETIEQALPAYLLFIDSMANKPNVDSEVLLSAARLYAIYSATFVQNEERKQRISERALDYALRGTCEYKASLCGIRNLAYEDFVRRFDSLVAEDSSQIYVLGLAWVNWIQAHKKDWNAVAQLAQVKYIMSKVVETNESIEDGGAHYILGIINTLVPPALGGKPEIARAHFEKAIELSHHRNFSYQVGLAEYYARLVFDKQLHDSLLTAVLDDKGEYEDYTLINVLAKRKAAELMATSNDYF